jgi:precorrin-3B methylase
MQTLRLVVRLAFVVVVVVVVAGIPAALAAASAVGAYLAQPAVACAMPREEV